MKTATLAILVRDGNVLLGLKKDGAEIGSGTYNGPGGKVLLNETPLEGVRREIQEEVGLEIPPESLSKIGVITFFAADEPDFQVHLFRSTDFSGEPIETEEMIPFWFPVDQLPTDRMLESDLHWFPHAIRGDVFDANVFYRHRAKDFERIEFLPRS
jgi:8-oxo-dGTP pyrophosphatase MutT (NUDIX family)